MERRIAGYFCLIVLVFFGISVNAKLMSTDDTSIQTLYPKGFITQCLKMTSGTVVGWGSCSSSSGNGGTLGSFNNGDAYSTISNGTGYYATLRINNSAIYNGTIANADILQYSTVSGWSAEDNGGTLGSINNGNALITIANGTGYYTTITPVATLSSYTNNSNWSSEANGGTMRSIQLSGDNGVTFSVASLSGNGGALRATFDSSLINAGTVTNVSNGDIYLSIANKTTTPVITMNGALASWSTKARPSGVVIGTTDTQTLTNKTIEAATINGVTTIDNIRAKTTAGILFESLSGTDVANFGVANTANVAFYGGVSMKTTTFNGNTMSLPTLSQGSILYSKVGGSLAALDNGASSNHKALKVNGNTLVWETAPSGSGTSTGTNTGDQTITLTGDVTGSGTGSFATTVASQTSANWATKISDEVGTGRLVFNGSTTLASPTLVTPAIGVATGTSLVTTGKIIAGTNVNGSNLAVKNGGYFIAGINFGNGGTTESIDFSKNNNFAISLNAATLAISASTDPTGDTRFSIAINQRTGSQAVTWTACASASGFCFPGGVTPTITITANAIDIISCWYRISKDRYYCVQSGDFR